jgi:hypothetical protein
MKIMPKFLGMAAAAVALALAAPVTAQTTTVMVSGQFVGRGTVIGSISYGSGSMWNLTTRGGPDGGFDYTNINSSIVAFTRSTFDVVEYVGFPNSLSDLHLVFANGAGRSYRPSAEQLVRVLQLLRLPKQRTQLSGLRTSQHRGAGAGDLGAADAGSRVDGRRASVCT